eukprot:SAG25_NODE_59_length_18387_cov_33.379770_3_plen_284_part_00
MQDSPAHNRITAVAFWLYSVVGATVYYSWPVALKSATTLVDARTNAIRAAVRTERQARQGEAFWESAVVAPSKELVKALEVLNEGFAGGLILQVALSLLIIVVLVCILLSKWFAGLDGDMELLVGSLCCVGLVVNAVPAVQCTMLLGAVSTSCDDFTEDLNTLRGENFDLQTDARIFMLERFLKNVNHNQGIGFRIGGLVLTKKILFILFAEFLAGLAVVLPIILRNSVLGHTAEHTTTSTVAAATAACLPSAQQVAVIKASLTSDIANCTFDNMTVGAIRGM